MIKLGTSPERAKQLEIEKKAAAEAAAKAKLDAKIEKKKPE